MPSFLSMCAFFTLVFLAQALYARRLMQRFRRGNNQAAFRAILPMYWVAVVCASFYSVLLVQGLIRWLTTLSNGGQ